MEIQINFFYHFLLMNAHVCFTTARKLRIYCTRSHNWMKLVCKDIHVKRHGRVWLPVEVLSAPMRDVRHAATLHTYTMNMEGKCCVRFAIRSRSHGNRNACNIPRLLIFVSEKLPSFESFLFVMLTLTVLVLSAWLEKRHRLKQKQTQGNLINNN